MTGVSTNLTTTYTAFAAKCVELGISKAEGLRRAVPAWLATFAAPVVTPPTPGPIPAPTPTPTAAPYLTGASFIWDPIGANPKLDPNSAAMAVALAGGKHVVDAIQFGVPLYEIPAGGTAPEYAIKPLWTEYAPFTARIPLGAVPSPGSPGWTDGAMVVIDWPRGYLYEFYVAAFTGSTWTCTSANRYPIDGDGRTDGLSPYGVTGWGVSRLAGLITAADWERAKTAGDLGHALTFSTLLAMPGKTNYRGPATKTDGSSKATTTIPEGARVQLDPTLDVTGLPFVQRVIAATLQRFGAYVIDNGGATVAIIATGLAPAAGLTDDYQGLEGIDWGRLRVLAA